MTATAPTVKADRSKGASDLWAITSYYNPMGYARRRQNYRTFRNALDVNLVAVELAYGQHFELDDDDAEIVVRLKSGDVLWQKERLLNVALAALPPECTKVAWVDCDVVFEETDWAERTSAALERHMIVQPFSRVHHMRPDAETDSAAGLRAGVAMSQASTASAISGGVPVRDAMAASLYRGAENYIAGLAWAARRAPLEEHNLYDVCVVGGGDTEFLGAALGQPDLAAKMHCLNPRQRECFAAWAGPFHETVQGSLDSVDGDLYHLWHGDLANRAAGPRHRILSELGFDPMADVALAEGGGWLWVTEKPELHRYVRQFFANRREDG